MEKACEKDSYSVRHEDNRKLAFGYFNNFLQHQASYED